jgi:hypothetical protein
MRIQKTLLGIVLLGMFLEGAAVKPAEAGAEGGGNALVSPIYCKRRPACLCQRLQNYG